MARLRLIVPAMAAYKCLDCLRLWPYKVGYGHCVCKGNQCVYDSADPPSDDEAVSAVNHILFEKYWQTWELERFQAQLADL